MILNEISPASSKEEVFEQVEKYLRQEGLRISEKDSARPWGGFFVIDEKQIREFKNKFFQDVEMSEQQLSQKLSPKFLLVAPHQKLSWQYHFRRSELWKLISGDAGIVRSQDDNLGPLEFMKTGETVSLSKGERHRLVGMENWGVVAEIWVHSDPQNPSDENDIVRLEDDYSRK
ncbi:phosphoheptose isomerase [Algoriphagus sp. CAU 1675]|uniref:phosphoheptose isomerase n=1 Tax=Algoriphagus sp. CAU 1675 TaxID=3032597 RepID=UPI0023DB0AFB|nr:phosphoheptose isomerase [Algoriphagus sp. CAU 1675]MDF2158292.1 phosphoheptose isomerase [Algoriphagus sp. CAU 1675]